MKIRKNVEWFLDCSGRNQYLFLLFYDCTMCRIGIFEFHSRRPSSFGRECCILDVMTFLFHSWQKIYGLFHAEFVLLDITSLCGRYDGVWLKSSFEWHWIYENVCDVYATDDVDGTNYYQWPFCVLLGVNCFAWFAMKCLDGGNRLRRNGRLTKTTMMSLTF
jgi:hypothetical protein